MKPPEKKLLSPNVLLNAIYHHVTKHGVHTHKPKSEFGRDEYTLDGVVVGLEDGGWTQLVLTPEVIAYAGGNNPVVFSRGAAEDLLNIASKFGIPVSAE